MDSPLEDRRTSKVSLESLFNYGRIKQPFSLAHVAFFFYVPFGFVLLVVRLLLWTLLMLYLLVNPRTRIVGPLLLKLSTGIISIYNGKEHLPREDDPDAARVIVCNHVSDFDPFPIWLTVPNFHTLVAVHISKIPLVGRAYAALHAIYVDPAKKDSVREVVVDVLKKSKYPVLVYPEGGLTSGKAGLLLYHKFVFSLNYKVLPIAMRVRDPWPIDLDYMNSSWAKNFFWFLFVPFHVYELNFLPAQEQHQNESDGDFANRIAKQTADFLGIEATHHSYSQKKELAASLRKKKTL